MIVRTKNHLIRMRTGNHHHSRHRQTSHPFDLAWYHPWSAGIAHRSHVEKARLSRLDDHLSVFAADLEFRSYVKGAVRSCSLLCSV